MAVFAVFPSTIMGVAFGRHTVVESIMVDGKTAKIAIQPTPTINLQHIPIPIGRPLF